jgi:hypothetical protein
VVARAPAILWDGSSDAVVINTGPLGFAGAPEADRARWITAFRRLLDGLDAPVQVVIDIEPGSEPDEAGTPALPPDGTDTRGADMRFVDQIARSQSAHRCTVSLVTAEAQAPRLEAALREIGISSSTSAAPKDAIFGSERAGLFTHSGGCSRTWYIERLPGSELEAGWLHRLMPRGLKLSLSWHATPLPVAWIVQYLQRQLVGMRATRLQEQSAGTADPALAGTRLFPNQGRQ